MPTINGKTYRAGEVPESILESLGLDQLREVALAEQHELEQLSLGVAKSNEALAKAGHREEIKAEAKRLGEEARAEMLPMDELREIVDRQILEAGKEDERRKQFEQQEMDAMEKELQGKSPQEIEQEFIEAQAKERLKPVEESPEAQQTPSLAKETDDLQYVHDQLQENVNRLIDQRLRQTQAADAAIIEKSLAIQRAFVESHPYYAPTLANGEAMKAYIIGTGAKEFTAENLHQAWLILKDKGELDLLSQTQVEAREQLQTQFRTGEKPRRAKSSTVSTTRGSSMYDYKKKELTEEDLETMPLDKLKKLIEQNADPIELAEEQRRAQTLGRF